MRRGHDAAAARQLVREEGPRPEQAIAEALAAADALQEAFVWPGPRDAVSERAVQEVRARWVRIERNAQQANAR